MEQNPAAPVALGDDFKIRYSICTLVSDMAQYEAAVASLRAGGFDNHNCEFFYVDNTRGNVRDGFQACNLFLRRAVGQFVILCHQDIRLLTDGRSRLDAIIAQLDELDPNWALFGNAGGLSDGRLAIRITDGNGPDQNIGGPFPQRCRSLDENFIVIRADANIAVSSDLSGFHFYGTDLCVVARILGRTAYVVDFHLEHFGSGRAESGSNIGSAFAMAREAMIRKYARTLFPGLITTTCATVFLTPFMPLAYLANTGKGLIAVKFLRRWLTRLIGPVP